MGTQNSNSLPHATFGKRKAVIFVKNRKLFCKKDRK